jgi:hypothetical protein
MGDDSLVYLGVIYFHIQTESIFSLHIYLASDNFLTDFDVSVRHYTYYSYLDGGGVGIFNNPGQRMLSMHHKASNSPLHQCYWSIAFHNPFITWYTNMGAVERQGGYLIFTGKWDEDRIRFAFT